MDPVTPLSILVVEDEALIRMLVVEALEEAGFAVTEAVCADNAVTILEVRAPEIDVVFSDIQMPGRMNGVDLAAQVRRCWPWIGVILTSGKAVPKQAGACRDIGFLNKPYLLGDVVNRVLEIGSRNSGLTMTRGSAASGNPH